MGTGDEGSVGKKTVASLNRVATGGSVQKVTPECSLEREEG